MAWGVTAGGNYGKGYGDGDSTTHRHSQIGDLGSQTTLKSGGDTTIKGAQVKGKGIDLSAENLLIESVQDTASYHGKQQNISAEGTFGYGASVSGSYNQSKIHADHASVTEQSGIYAGDDGYRVQVKQHTDLKGGLITSTQAAEDSNKNQFSTNTLSHSDIQNHSYYDGKSLGIGGNMNVSGQSLGQKPPAPNSKLKSFENGFGSSMGYGSDSDSQNSITQSGINTKNIHINNDVTGEQTQSIHTNITTETAANHSGNLDNRFNREQLQKELDLQRQVSQDFNRNTQAASVEINKKVQEHTDNAEQLKTEAQQAWTKNDLNTYYQKLQEASQAEQSAQNWQKTNVLLNAIASGLSAPTNSTQGIVAATASPAISYEIGQYFKENKAEGTPAHIAAHAVLGAATAAAGGNNALAGALSAGSAEAAAPVISRWLHGTADPKKLTPEQKDTVAAITRALGAGVGAAVGGGSANVAQGSLNADSAVGNNGNTGRNSNPSIRQQRVELGANAAEELLDLLLTGGTVGEVKRAWADLGYKLKYDELLRLQNQIERLGYKVPLEKTWDRDGNIMIDIERSMKNINFALSRLKNAATSEKAALAEAKRSGHILKTMNPLAVRAVKYRDSARNVNNDDMATEYLYQNIKGEYVVLQRHHLGHIYISAFDKNTIDINSSQPAHWNVRHYPLGTTIDPKIWSSNEEVNKINKRLSGHSKYGEPISYPENRKIPDHIPYSTKRKNK